MDSDAEREAFRQKLRREVRADHIAGIVVLAIAVLPFIFLVWHLLNHF
jgi:hypothetical protein